MSLLTVPIPDNTYQVGSAPISAQAVPAGAVQMVCTFATVNWTNPLAALHIALEVSRNNQATWTGGGESTTACGSDGLFHNRSGGVLSTISSEFTWPSGVTHLRGTVTISGAAIHTNGTVVVN